MGANKLARAREHSARYRAANRTAIREYHKRWHMENPGRRRKYSQTYKLKREFGMTLADYDAMLAAQEGRCAVCRSDDPVGPENRYSFCVDHCHVTGKVRGLLCFRCNIALGYHENQYLPHREAFDAYLRKGKV